MIYRANKSKVKSGLVRYDRVNFLAVLVFAFALVLVIKLFFLQIIEHSAYEALAQGQHKLFQDLWPERGEILVRDKANPDKLFPLATNQTLNFIYAVPKNIENPSEAAVKIAAILDLDQATLETRLAKPDDLYEPVKRGVTNELWERVKALAISGVESRPESYRYYPENQIGSHVLGFVGQREESEQKNGQYGLEGYFNKELSGQQGFIQTEKDAGGRWITVGGLKIQEAEDGADLILTLDHTIQYTACAKLEAEVLKHGADSGSLIILEPKTGAILAMCGYPDYDPNKYNEVENIEVYKNPATYSTYEPGSVFKPITMAAALDQGEVTPQTTYTDTGEEKIGPYTIKNSDGKANGVQTMTEVLEKSLNTGVIFAMREIGEKTFSKYVKDFGFGEKTGMTLDTESVGDISNLKENKEIYAATASFGQGITVTPLQIVSAFGAIANKGKLMKPYLIDEIIKPDGFKEKTAPEEVRQVISPQTATTLSAMLVNVVRNGHGKRAGVDGYFIAGKTGTAQVPKKDGPGYETDFTIGTFCGFAPVDDPKFAMIIKIDRPRDVMWAESSAAPLFGELAKFLLQYYEIPPSVDIEE